MIGEAVKFVRCRSLAAVALLCVVASCNKTSPPNSPTSTQPVSTGSITDAKIEQSLAAAQEYVQRNELTKAQAILVVLIERSPGEVRAREMYGQVLTVMAMEADRNGQADASWQCRQKAFEQYQAAVDADPKSAGLRHSAAMMAMAAGRNEDALRLFAEAGKLDPANPQHPLFEAQLLIGMKEYDRATQTIKRVLTLDPDEPLAHATLAMIALEQNRFDDALAAMGEARKIDPASVDFRAQEARIHRRRGVPNRAIELLLGLSAAERGKEIVAYELATSYSDLGQHRQAAQAWQLCFNINAGKSRTYLWAVRTGQELLKAGDRDQAARWLQQAQFLAPNAPEVIALSDELAK